MTVGRLISVRSFDGIRGIATGGALTTGRLIDSPGSSSVHGDGADGAAGGLGAVGGGTPPAGTTHAGGGTFIACAGTDLLIGGRGVEIAASTSGVCIGSVFGGGAGARCTTVDCETAGGTAPRGRGSVITSGERVDTGVGTGGPSGRETSGCLNRCSSGRGAATPGPCVVGTGGLAAAARAAASCRSTAAFSSA